MNNEPSHHILTYDDIKAILAFIHTIVLSSLGGCLYYFEKIKKLKQAFSKNDFILDVGISCYAGYLTYLSCETLGVTGAKAALAISVSGHMGTRAIGLIQNRWKS